jgi:hypothetical protein
MVRPSESESLGAGPHALGGDFGLRSGRLWGREPLRFGRFGSYRGKEVSLFIQRIRETSTRGWLTLRASLTDGWAIRRGSGPPLLGPGVHRSSRADGYGLVPGELGAVARHYVRRGRAHRLPGYLPEQREGTEARDRKASPSARSRWRWSRRAPCPEGCFTPGSHTSACHKEGPHGWPGIIPTAGAVR